MTTVHRKKAILGFFVYLYLSKVTTTKVSFRFCKQCSQGTLRLVYQNNGLSFAELLEEDIFVKIYQRNLQVLATEIFKLKNRLAPEIMKKVFKIQNPGYNFRSEATHFKRENVKTTHYGIQLIRYLGPKI